MPDAELFTLAGKKQLSTSLDAQVKRMLKDPRATALDACARSGGGIVFISRGLLWGAQSACCSSR